MKFTIEKYVDPGLWMFGIVSIIYPGTSKRTWAIHVWNRALILFPKSKGYRL